MNDNEPFTVPYQGASFINNDLFLARDFSPRFTLIDTSGAGADLVGTSDIADGEWHHVVAVRDAISGENRLFVDGVELANGFRELTDGEEHQPGSPHGVDGQVLDEIVAVVGEDILLRSEVDAFVASVMQQQEGMDYS